MSRRKSLWRRIWYFIWEEDSALSWIVNIVIAFVLIKYMIYPGLGLVLGTTHPVVAVVSGSMEHKLVNGEICGKYPDNYNSNFDNYWDTCGDFYRNLDINKLEFEKFPLKNGFNTGDIIVLLGNNPNEIKIGDVIVFGANKPDPIIHRVIKIWQNEDYHFQTKGDHNPHPIDNEVKELDIHEERIIGKAVFKIPFLGYIKIWFVDLLKLLHLDTSVGRLFR